MTTPPPAAHDTHRVEPDGPPPVGRLIRWGLLLLVVLTVAGLAPRLTRRFQLNTETRDRMAEKQRVTVCKPTPAPRGGLSLPGSVEAIEQAEINARTSGYVRKRLVDLGDPVRRGQVLAEIAAPDVDLQYQQAAADSERAAAGASQADAEVARQQANLRQAQAQVTTVSAQLSQAQANWAAALARAQQARHALDGQRANLRKTEAQQVLAERTWSRYHGLVNQGFVTQQDADTAEASYRSAVASTEAARTAVSGAESDVRAAEAALTAADANVQSNRSALAASRQQVTAGEAAVRSADAALQAARAGRASGEANRARAEVLRGFEQVVAPFDGVITSRNVDVGQLLKADNVTTGGNSTGLFGIARTDVMRVMVNAPQTFLPYLKVGDTAELAVHEYPARVFSGTVTHIAGGLDDASRTLQVEVRVKNADGALRTGMYSDVSLGADKTSPLLRVPATALVSDGQGTRVATVTADGHVHFVPVVIDRDLGSELQIARGLTADDRVVVNPTDDLVEGSVVEVVTPPASSPSAAASAEARPQQHH